MSEIVRLKDIKENPKDGVMIDTEMVISQFSKDGKCKEQERHKGRILASMSQGGLSFSDHEAKNMITVSIIEVLELLGEAIAVSRGEK